MPTSRPLPILAPGQLREVPRSFAWIDHRLRSESWLERMRPEEIGLYLFLVLAADRNGLSCWRLERVERAMPCFDPVSLGKAREGLMRLGLLAFRPWSKHAVDGSYQVLAVPCPRPRAQPRQDEPVLLGDLIDEALDL